MKYKILIVDDDPSIREIIEYNLIKEGYETYTASNGRQALDVAEEVNPDLIILDVMMPDMDGIECCKILRSNVNMKDVVITFLSARSEDYSQIAGFDAGADDYIAKPIRPNLLNSRVKALLKRVVKKEIDSFRIDKDKHMVFLEGGGKVQLPRKEFGILSLLHSQPQRVFSREEIFLNIWGNDIIVGERTMDVHIRKLREKIGEHHIVTIKGIGYKFEEDNT